MKAWLRKLRDSRSPRDRAVIALLAAVVAVVLYVWLVQSANRARTQLGASAADLRAQALRLDMDATELARVRAAPAPAAPSTDLRTLLKARADAAGLSGALLRIDAPEPNQVQLVFGAVAFADWLAWVASLQAEYIRLDTARIEALSTPGMVGITATFTAARAQ
jgi:general secretion pathway protein M